MMPRIATRTLRTPALGSSSTSLIRRSGNLLAASSTSRFRARMSSRIRTMRTSVAAATWPAPIASARRLVASSAAPRPSRRSACTWLAASSSVTGDPASWSSSLTMKTGAPFSMTM